MTFAAPGILIVDKPAGAGETSARTTAAAKKLYHARRAGHGGALDPLASGVLPIFFNEATAFAAFALGGDKTYDARVRFGAATATDDADGEVIARKPPPDLALLAPIIPEFIGEIEQTAPAYSALKYRGRPLYDYARRGEQAPAKTRRVRIDSIRVTAIENADAIMEIVCGSGVYIRALARDLGARLGCGAHLAALRRTRSGGFAIQDAARLTDLAQMTPARRIDKLLPPSAACARLPALQFSREQIGRLAHGQTFAHAAADGIYRADVGGEFAGLVQIRDRVAAPRKVLSSWREALVREALAPEAPAPATRAAR